MIERHLDYFAASLMFPEMICRDNQYKSVPAIAFYKRGYEDETGTRYYYGNPNSKKCLVVLSGRVLEYFRISGNTDSEIVASFVEKGARCSRIDMAVTEWIEDNLVTLDDVEGWFTGGKIKSSWVSGGCKALVEIPEQGERATQTLYIGDMEARGKKGIFRAYDKGVEMDLGKYMVTRLEVEDRGDKAMVSARRIAAGASVASVFRTRFDVDDEQFERLMQSPVAELTRRSNLPKRDEIDVQAGRWQWLINQIAPSIKQAIADDNRLDMNDANLTKFLVASGLLGLMRDGANDLARKLYRDTLESNGLLETDFTK